MQLSQRIFEVIIDGREISGLQMKFEISKLSLGTLQQGFVSIFNLSDATDTFIKERGQRIQIVAGYEGLSGLIFDGDIRSILRTRENLDRVTTIRIGGNVTRLTRARFVKSYKGNVSIKQIIIDALPTFVGVSFNNTEILPDIQKSDFAYADRTLDLLTKLLIPNGVSWYEDLGIISFFKIDETTPVENAFVISPTSGLIGVPGLTQIPLDPSKKPGVKFISLLNPFLTNQSIVKLETSVKFLSGGGRDQNLRAGETSGFYKLTSVKHQGETRGNSFYTICEGLAV